MANPDLMRDACIILVVCAATAMAASAQSFTTLHSFESTDGAFPYAGLIQATDGNFYGTTSGGGAYDYYGTVFKIAPVGTLTTLHSFNGTDGSLPLRLIQATNGNFYGTTEEGGTYGFGTVFKITPRGTLTTLHSFDSSDGKFPVGGLSQATDGNFYGTTYEGGASGYGTIFKITPRGTLTTLHSFDGYHDGALPWDRLIQATDGNFYGTTQTGGTYDHGTIFEITAGGTLTTLHSFDFVDGDQAHAGLIQSTDGNLYGTTYGGGADPKCRRPLFGCGTVFSMTPEGVLATLHSFDSTDGANPSAGMIQASNVNFYGTTTSGAGWRCKGGCGTVFQITSGGTLTTLHSFSSADGAAPWGELIQAVDGNFYGTTAQGGAYGYGTIFRLILAPEVRLSATSLSFGNQTLDETSVAKTVTLKNSGTAPLVVKRMSVDGTFTISANTCGAVLDVGETCRVSVTFMPRVSGKVAGTLTFSDDASNSPQVVLLWGTGVEPVTLMPPGAAYGLQVVGTTSTPKTFTLTNYQDVALTGITISTSGDFAMSASTCTSNLSAKSKCTINLTFTPKALGTRTGTLSVSDNASNSSQTSNLRGTGK